MNSNKVDKMAPGNEMEDLNNKKTEKQDQGTGLKI